MIWAKTAVPAGERFAITQLRQQRTKSCSEGIFKNGRFNCNGYAASWFFRPIRRHYKEAKPQKRLPLRSPICSCHGLLEAHCQTWATHFHNEVAQIAATSTIPDRQGHAGE